MELCPLERAAQGTVNPGGVPAGVLSWAKHVLWPSSASRRPRGAGWGGGGGTQDLQLAKGVPPQVSGWCSPQVWSAVSSFKCRWEIAGRASEAVMVGGRWPRGAGQLLRTHPDHTVGRGPPSSRVALGHKPRSGVSPPTHSRRHPRFCDLEPLHSPSPLSSPTQLMSRPRGRQGSLGNSPWKC